MNRSGTQRVPLHRKLRQERETGKLTFPLALPELAGSVTQVADGVWWIALPLTTHLDRVNIYVLDDGDDGLTLVDTGANGVTSRELLLEALSKPPFAGKQCHRVIATHFHPDHIGLAGYFCDRGASLWTSPGTVTTAWRLWNDQPALPHPEDLEFMQRAGISDLELAAISRRRPRTYADHVERLPQTYTRLSEGDLISAGGRQWSVRMGHGHAEDHVTLWTDELALVGDQILPGISPNLSVHFSNPEANPIQDWLASCKRFEAEALEHTLCLPGHNRPFFGAPFRCEQLRTNCCNALKRLDEHLRKPSHAAGCMHAVYRRELSSYERPLLIGEMVGYLNFLYQKQLIDRTLTRTGHYRYRKSRGAKLLKEILRND